VHLSSFAGLYLFTDKLLVIGAFAAVTFFADFLGAFFAAMNSSLLM
jgi:hypothetical protein